MDARAVPLRTKLAYGVADVAINVKNSSLNQFLLFFYADVVHLAPAVVGAALFVGKLWDAVTDPVMGYLSDTTRSRWGRRRPYVLLSAVPMGVCFYLLFSPPALSSAGLASYFLAVNLLLFTAFTVFAVPYMAWGAEIATDYHERTELVQIRALFGVLGGILGATVPSLAHTREEFSLVALVLAVLIVASTLATGLSVADPSRTRLPAASLAHFRAGLRQTFANREFKAIFVTFCLMTVAAVLGQSVQLIVIKYWLQLYDFFRWLALTFALSFVASFPLWFALSRRIGKQRALMTGLALGCVVPFGWVFVGPGERTAMLAFMVAAGINTGSITLALSQAIDVVEIDAQRTGERREGAYFGVWTLGLKTMGALGVLLGGVLLEIVGYVPGQVPEPRTLWWLVMAVGPLQAAVHFAALLVLRRVRFDARIIVPPGAVAPSPAE
jgi:Na+/melibiose symporter-like transporter